MVIAIFSKPFEAQYQRSRAKHDALRKRLRIRSVISVNYHYITLLYLLTLLIRFKCYNTV